jgi:hypothetical protein
MGQASSEELEKVVSDIFDTRISKIKQLYPAIDRYQASETRGAVEAMTGRQAGAQGHSRLDIQGEKARRAALRGGTSGTQAIKR